jgi:hypothetical protein
MAGARVCGAILIVLCSATAISEENRGLPAAPSSLMQSNASLQVTVPPDPFATNAPEFAHRVIDKQFLFLSAVATTAIFADSYTTTWIENNSRSRGPGPCTLEGGEPQLYGLHPTVARTYAIGVALSAGAIGLSYLAKKHLPSRVKWMWPSAFLYETGISIHGFSTNLSRC